MMTSYTHNCEDVLLFRALSDIEIGFYIDVGAYDPVMDSVTKIFYDRGWRGINLEPNEFYHDRLQDARPRDQNLRLAASDHSGQLDFYVVEDTGLSTLDENQARASAGQTHALRKTTVITDTLEAIWDRYVPPGQSVQFLKIDVEGAESKVIAGANWERHRPWVLVIEATIPNTTILSSASWEPAILAANYLPAYFDGVNLYFVAQEKSNLLEWFNRPANPMVDNFKPFLAELIERNKEEAIIRLQGELSNVRDELETAKRERDLLSPSNIALRKTHDELQRQISDLFGINEQLRRHVDLASSALARRKRPLWEKIVFRSSGRPKKLFRRALFHKSGKPRGIFRNLILKKDGTPHSPFRGWMNSQEYRQLRNAVKFNASSDTSLVPTLPPVPQDLTPRAKELLADMNARMDKGLRE